MIRVIFQAVLIATLTLAGCANSPTVSPSEPHGIVSVQNFTTAARTHPLVVVEINGINMLNRTRTASFWLPPGTHTLRVMAFIEEPTHIRSVPDPGRVGYPEFDLTIEVEAGKHYLIAAKETGPRATDWKPVVVSVRDI